MEGHGSPKRIKHMETMMLAEMEPGSFFWWFFRNFLSVVWTLCAVITLFLINCIIISKGTTGFTGSKLKGIFQVSVTFIFFCVFPMAPALSMFVDVGCGPWLVDDERAGIIQACEVERQAKIVQVNVERRAEATRIEAERKAVVERSLTENQTRALQRLAQFSDSEGASITQIIEQLKAAEEGLRGKIIGLKEVLVGVGNDPEKDQEYLSWGQMLERLIRDRHDLERKLEDAFLASERFQLAPSDAFKTEMTGHISKGIELANEFAGRYRELMQWK